MNAQLEALKDQMSNCGSCDLCKTRTQVVFGEGSPSPLIMLLGESPGETEDLDGKPFVGKVGEKLDNMLKYVGVARDEVYITNAVLCKTPQNREPRKEELDSCRWRLNLQIKLLKPKLIVVLGKVALSQLKGEPVKGALNKFFQDNWFNYTVDGHVSKVIVTYHPNFHLKSPEKAYKETLPHWTKIREWYKDAVENKTTS